MSDAAFELVQGPDGRVSAFWRTSAGAPSPLPNLEDCLIADRVCRVRYDRAPEVFDLGIVTCLGISVVCGYREPTGFIEGSEG